MIVFSSGISMMNPFLVKSALDNGILGHNGTILTETVLGMVGVAIISQATSVWQTYISNAVGQQVMHDLRAAVYHRLQQMSLAFFTRTRTGEVQSRISNDIGGLDNVITNTATTIASNVTTVIGAVVAMCILNWRLAVISLIFVPPSVWLTRKVGKIRRRITTEQQRRLADMSALVAESLSVSGIMLGKTMGRGDDLADRFTGESRTSPISRCARGWRVAGRWPRSSSCSRSRRRSSTGSPGSRSSGTSIKIGTVVAFTTLQTRLLFPIQSLLGAGADVEASLALFDRIFEYIDLPIDIVEAEHPVVLDPASCRRGALRRGVVPLRRRRWPAGRRRRWTVHDIDLVVPAGTRTAIVGETGAGKTTLGYLVARLYEPQRGRITIDGVDIRDAPSTRWRRPWRGVAGDLPVSRERAREPALRAARGERRGDRGRRADCADPRPDRVVARRLRHDRGGARVSLLRRGEAAHGDRAHGAAQPAGADLRRGHLVA